MRKINDQCGRLREKIFSNACVLPSLIGVLIFFIIPFGIVVYYSVINNAVMKEFVGLENYKKLFTTVAFRRAAFNTSVFTLISVPLAVVVPMLLAVVMERKIPGRSVFRTFFLSPLMVPTASVVLVWQVIFHNHGTLNQFMELFGINGVDWLRSSYGHIVIILMFLWKNTGYNMILFMAALAAVPRDLLEVAELEGAGRLYRFIHIKLRYLSPTIIFVIILSLINSFKIFREVYLLTGDYPYKLYMLQHFMNNTFNSFDYQKLSSAAVLLSLVMIVMIAVLLAADNFFGKDLEN